MKKNTHPQYYPKAKVACACGNSFTIGSTREELKVEICSDCHPFYTGKEKIIDIAGRVEKFKVRRATAITKQEKEVTRKKEKAAETKEKTKKGKTPKSLPGKASKKKTQKTAK